MENKIGFTITIISIIIVLIWIIRLYIFLNYYRSECDKEEAKAKVLQIKIKESGLYYTPPDSLEKLQRIISDYDAKKEMKKLLK